jgi:hypothetical protein
MSKSEIKSMYNSLLDSGDLFVFFPSLTGVWESDKKEFIKHYNKNLNDIEDLSFDFDDHNDFLDEY